MNCLGKPVIQILAGGIMLLLLSSCGYRLEGGGPVYPGVSRVGVEVFANRTAYTHAGIDFTNELIREIQDRTDTRVVAPEDTAYLIKGVIKSITFAILSRSSTETVTERQVTAVVDVLLLAPDRKILWSANDFSAFESYTVGEDNDDANIRKALEIIAKRVAERIVSQMSADF